MLNNLSADLCLPLVFSWLKGSSLVWTPHLCPTLGRTLWMPDNYHIHSTQNAVSRCKCHSLFSSFSLLRKKSAKLKTSYKRDFVNVGCDLDFDMAGPTIHAAAVLGYEGWLAGYQLAFDTAKSRLTQNNFAFGYRAGDFQLHTSVWVRLSQAGEARTENWVWEPKGNILRAAITFALSFQSWWHRVWWLCLSEGEQQPGDSGDPGLDSWKQQHALWCWSQIPAG